MHRRSINPRGRGVGGEEAGGPVSPSIGDAVKQTGARLGKFEKGSAERFNRFDPDGWWGGGVVGGG